ncbi:hypothetical protein [Flavobacterium sp. I3-2]|uniref:hypothetical protein n=1 Tax=Flavobacterium sp. I3-2 TaxID=2748319 RepID=UPI0015A8B07A|nr:hypothetical protein [Flavobacterium sp. I3-2]
MMKKKFIVCLTALSTILVMLSSCEKEDETEPFKQEPEINYNLKSIDFPETGIYSLDGQTFEYDNLNRVTKMISGQDYSVIYGDNLITLDLIRHNFSSYIDVKGKINIHLLEDKVQKITFETIFVGQTKNRIDRDSLTFTYDNNLLKEIKSFYSQDNRPFENTSKIEFTHSNGNITKVKKDLFYEELISEYTYDSEKFIENGDLVYETPLFKVLNVFSVLIKDKIGLKSKNNILTVTNSFNEEKKPHTYISFLKYTRKFDDFGRLTSIRIDGNGFNYNDVQINNAEVVLKY